VKRILTLLAVAGLVTACADSTNNSSLSTLASAFQSVPVGFDNAQHSFAGSPGGDAGNPEWGPHGDRGGPGRGGHDGVGPGFGGFMGGGLGGLFIGDGFGLGFGHGRGDGDLIGVCTYDSDTGRITCDPVTSRGLTVTRSAAYKDVNGNSQSAFDTLTTNSINVQVSVTGTRIRRDSDTSVVNEQSDRTVGGLAPSSSQRTIDGSSKASENTTGTDSAGHFTAVRLAGDTTIGVIVPKPSGVTEHPFPTAGTVTRSMTVTVTYDGQGPEIRSRREVVSYDGTSTAKIVITEDGTTKNCTLPLPRGRLSCS
jgi:hypothetical protein